MFSGSRQRTAVQYRHYAAAPRTHPVWLLILLLLGLRLLLCVPTISEDVPVAEHDIEHLRDLQQLDANQNYSPIIVNGDESADEESPTSRQGPISGCVCTLQHDPVCGVDGQTYSNACIANNCGQGVEVAFKGECPTTGGG